MTIKQLEYFIEITKCNSINEAAKNLYISQPSLSNTIKELEHEFNIVLFNRTNKGIVLSNEGKEFLGYAKQIIEQTQLLKDHYLDTNRKMKFSISCQHYAFAINAFIQLIQEYGYNEYDFTIQETKTANIIEDVKNMKSEIGILYLNDFNKKVLNRLFDENNLIFTKLFEAKPHVFISKHHPLANNSHLLLNQLDEYPYLSFDQGNNNSFYYSEEIASTYIHKKSIKVTDRATLFNLLLGLNGYTISTGIISNDLNPDIIAIPLKMNDIIEIGYIRNKNVPLSSIGNIYIDKLNSYIYNLL